MSRPRLSTQIARGFLRQCPNCGREGIFRWWKLVEFCPSCGHKFEREPGYWVGAVIFNTILAILALFASFGIFLAISWPDVPWAWLTLVVIATTALVPIVFYPWARSLWMAYDLYVHPIEDEEIRRAQSRLTP